MKKYINIILITFLLIGVSVTSYGLIKFIQGKLGVPSIDEAKNFNKDYFSPIKLYGETWNTLSVREQGEILSSHMDALKEGQNRAKMYRGLIFIVLGSGIILVPILLKVFFVK